MPSLLLIFQKISSLPVYSPTQMIFFPSYPLFLMIKAQIYCTFRISQTAPASPTIGRSRATSSSVPSGPGGQVDLDNHTFSESSAAASVGHLGEKVKKTIKQVNNF